MKYVNSQGVKKIQWSIVKFNQPHYKGERMEIPTTEEPPEATRELPEATKKLPKKPKGKLLLIINF